MNTTLGKLSPKKRKTPEGVFLNMINPNSPPGEMSTCQRLSQIRLQHFAAAGVFETANGLLLDLTHTFAGQIKTLTDFL